MNKFLTAVKTFVDDENGVTAIEYGLIAALIAVGIIASTTTVGDKVELAFKKVADGLTTAFP